MPVETAYAALERLDPGLRTLARDRRQPHYTRT